MRREKGFTFIELLVTVTIIMVLTAVGIVSYRVTNQKARDARRKSDLESVRSALEICRTETGAYPASIDFSNNAPITCGGTTYLAKAPSDPKVGQAGFGYTYTRTSNTTYTLCAEIETPGETTPYCITNP